MCHVTLSIAILLTETVWWNTEIKISKVRKSIQKMLLLMPFSILQFTENNLFQEFTRHVHNVWDDDKDTENTWKKLTSFIPKQQTLCCLYNRPWRVSYTFLIFLLLNLNIKLHLGCHLSIVIPEHINLTIKTKKVTN